MVALDIACMKPSTGRRQTRMRDGATPNTWTPVTEYRRIFRGVVEHVDMHEKIELLERFSTPLGIGVLDHDVRAEAEQSPDLVRLRVQHRIVKRVCLGAHARGAERALSQTDPLCQGFLPKTRGRRYGGWAERRTGRCPLERRNNL